MSRRSVLKLVSAAVLLCLVAIVATMVQPVSGKDSRRKHEVIMLRCEADASGFRVTAYSHSQSAPARRVDNCPENLSSLNRDGFDVLDVARFDVDGGYLVYTLVR